MGKAISSKNNLQHALYSKDFVLQILAYQRHRQEICEAERPQIKEILQTYLQLPKKKPDLYQDLTEHLRYLENELNSDWVFYGEIAQKFLILQRRSPQLSEWNANDAC